MLTIKQRKYYDAIVSGDSISGRNDQGPPCCGRPFSCASRGAGECARQLDHLGGAVPDRPGPVPEPPESPTCGQPARPQRQPPSRPPLADRGGSASSRQRGVAARRPVEPAGPG